MGKQKSLGQPFLMVIPMDVIMPMKNSIVGGLHDIAMVRNPHHGSQPSSFDKVVLKMVLLRVEFEEQSSIRPPPFTQSEPTSNVYRPTLTHILCSGIFRQFFLNFVTLGSYMIDSPRLMDKRRQENICSFIFCDIVSISNTTPTSCL